MANQTQTQANATETSDINSISLDQFIGEEIELGNFEKNKSDAPPPIKAGDYVVRYELGDADPEKAIGLGISPRYNSGRPFIKVKLKATVIESLNPEVETPQVFNRTVFANINSGIMNKGDASDVSDWLKSVGVEAGEMPTVLKRNAAGEVDCAATRAYLVNLLATDVTGRVHIDWYGSATSEVETDPKLKYIQPKAFKGMKKWPTDAEGNHIALVEQYHNKKTDELLNLKAYNEITKYYPA